MKSAHLALIALFLLPLTGLALEKRETVYGTPKIVYREFTVAPKECLAAMPATSGSRQVWKCVFRDSSLSNGFAFNPALTFTDKGRISTSSDIVQEIESHPNGGSIGFSAPDTAHPGYSRMIPFEEIKSLLERWSADPRIKTTFRGTYLAL